MDADLTGIGADFIGHHPALEGGLSQQRNIVEILMGAVVLLAAAGFIALAYEAADMKGAGGYEITPICSTGGLAAMDVRISRIKVGQITGQQLDPVTFVARISMVTPIRLLKSLPTVVCALRIAAVVTWR